MIAVYVLRSPDALLDLYVCFVLAALFIALWAWSRTEIKKLEK